MPTLALDTRDTRGCQHGQRAAENLARDQSLFTREAFQNAPTNVRTALTTAIQGAEEARKACVRETKKQRW